VLRDCDAWQASSSWLAIREGSWLGLIENDSHYCKM